MDFNYGNVTMEKIAEFIKNNVDAILVIDTKTNSYKSLIRKGIFATRTAL